MTALDVTLDSSVELRASLSDRLTGARAWARSRIRLPSSTNQGILMSLNRRTLPRPDWRRVALAWRSHLCWVWLSSPAASARQPEGKTLELKTVQTGGQARRPEGSCPFRRGFQGLQGLDVVLGPGRVRHRHDDRRQDQKQAVPLKVTFVRPNKVSTSTPARCGSRATAPR